MFASLQGTSNRMTMWWAAAEWHKRNTIVLILGYMRVCVYIYIYMVYITPGVDQATTHLLKSRLSILSLLTQHFWSQTLISLFRKTPCNLNGLTSFSAVAVGMGINQKRKELWGRDESCTKLALLQGRLEWVFFCVLLNSTQLKTS